MAEGNDANYFFISKMEEGRVADISPEMLARMYSTAGGKGRRNILKKGKHGGIQN